MRILYFLFVIVLFTSCSQEKDLTAQQIIDKAIKVAKIGNVANATVSFDFRDRGYIADRKNGVFSLQRITKQNDSIITDVLSNDGFHRLINNKLTKVVDSMALKYSESVNSVHYFSVLPYGLNDAAVNKKLLEFVSIKEKEYYKIEITFDQEGGGVDYEDVFIYWIDKEDFKVDYLAYTFHVNGGGKRFREVSKEHFVNGIRFVDYHNYKPLDQSIKLHQFDEAFKNGSLKKVSEINLENIKVSF